MKHLKKIFENVDKIKKIEGKTITYFDLFPLLSSLETERKGIRKRVWDFLCDNKDIRFSPINGRILCINLFFYGVGDEYPCDYLTEYPDELEHCKRTHPQAFVDGMDEKELRLDFNLIWSIYQHEEGANMEAFPIMPNW